MRVLLKTLVGLAFVCASPADATTLVTVAADTYLPGTTTIMTCDYFAQSCSSDTQPSTFHFVWFSTEDLDLLATGPHSYQANFGPTLQEYVTISLGGLDQWGNSILNAGVQVFASSNPHSCIGFGPNVPHCTTDMSSYYGSFQLTQIIPAPLPEPGTWAMLLLGFAAVGIALRRKAPRPSRKFRDLVPVGGGGACEFLKRG